MDDYINLHRLSQATLTDNICSVRPTHLRIQSVTANANQSHIAAPTPDHNNIGECIAPAVTFQFQRHSTASDETLHTEIDTRQPSLDSGFFHAPSLDSEADTICATASEEQKALAELETADPRPHVDSRRFTSLLRNCPHTARFVRSIKRLCLSGGRHSLPPPVAYSEPQYSLVGDIKTVRFDDCVTAPAAPCTDWDDVECQAVLVVGRDPTLPASETSRSSLKAGFRESRYGLNRLSQIFKHS